LTLVGNSLTEKEVINFISVTVLYINFFLSVECTLVAKRL